MAFSFFPGGSGIPQPAHGQAPAPMDVSTIPLSGRELPADMVDQLSNITMGQLLHILSHIKKLSAQAPPGMAQALLAENPQICHALLHAECIAGLIEEPLLPMKSEELKQAKKKARQMQEELAEHQLPPPAPAAPVAALANQAWPTSSPGIPQFKAPPPPPPSMPPPPVMQQPLAAMPMMVTPPQASGFPGVMPQTGLYQPAPAPGFPGSLPVATTPPMASTPPSPAGAPQDPESAKKQQLLKKLVKLSPAQIAELPEQTKVQLLQFLRQQGGPM
mmetsp:Transcript_43595/g.102776  ORF Transcript_43595/g.102776 Transcript_43595/m.102776 type:complete len:275 (-) Transcript_43595:217-1041(-)|eukprot:CAMPEP_0178421196 /NCGR_PEP_ID=MMETSP0689_2-20121128/26524_1 /TAXON_ID=160604 /ORGANISM="Amphidinium massartii, Strain CS-259" /LENGTH=274 /DNA_ID=CAMNT_0020042703 /DNA_START=90 /DNA_END=914 /DNA_ORIENTATION=+